MYTNEYRGCTVWEKTVVNHTPAYIRHHTGAVYWEDTSGEVISAAGSGMTRNPDDKAFIGIPAAHLDGYLPQTDDRIMRGEISDASPPKTAMTVTSVKDFRYGSARVQHIEVTAK